MKEEIWKPIEGFEGLYWISSHGRVRSNALNGECLKLRVASKYGHLRVALRKNGKRSFFGLHQLVLKAFIGPCPPNFESLHKNGKPWKNNIENLRYGTRLENAADRRRHGRAGDGSANGRAKLTPTCIERIRDMRKFGVPQKEIALLFGVIQAQISRIDRGLQWKTL